MALPREAGSAKMRTVRHFLTPLLLAATVFAGSAMAAEGPELVADNLTYDIGSHTRTASGNAVFVHEGITLEADVIYFDETTRTAHAVGNVRVTRPNYRLVTNDLSYNTDEKSFKCGPFRIGFPPMFLEGKSAHGTADKVELDDAIAYMGEPESSTPSLASEHMVLTADKRLIAVGAKPGIGKYTLFRIPRIAGKLEKLPNMDASVGIGYEGQLGAYTSIAADVPITSNLSAGANMDLYSKRGVMAGPTTSYKYEGGDTELRGSVSSGFIHDQKDPGYDYFAKPITDKRWFMEERHQQSIDDKVYITSYINMMSDPEMMRDFRSEGFKTNQYPDSYIETTYIAGEDVVVNALTRFSVAGNNYAMTQRLPELRVDYLTNPLPFGGVYQTGFFDAAITDETVDDEHWHNKRVHTYYGLTRPVPLTDWLQLTPKVGGFMGYYDRTYFYEGSKKFTSAGASTHYIGEMGADLVASFHADWDLKSDLWGIDGIRHVLRPVAYWRHYGATGDNDTLTTDSDHDFYSVQMPSIDLRDLEGNDSRYIVYNPHFVRFGLENIFQTRDSGVFSRELASLNLYHDANFDNHSLDCTYAQAAFKPFKFLTVSFENGFDTKPMSNEWSRARLTLKSSDQWTFQFYADYKDNYFEDYVGSYFYQFSRDWGSMVNVGYNAEDSEIDRFSVSVFENIGSFWKIRYRVSYNKNDLRHDDFTFAIAISGISF
jgi:LPS-assembly protein